MATYVLGDIHGCFETLRGLLEQIGFDASCDRLWAVGDLVNRGPRSLEVLRWARSLGTRFVSVLGNHDLHLLSCALRIRAAKQSDTLDPILAADDRRQLLDWIIRQPFIHMDDRYLLVHAGVMPEWTVSQMVEFSQQAQAALQENTRALLESIYEPLTCETETSTELERLAFRVRVFTRLRICNSQGQCCSGFTAPPNETPAGYRPWFLIPACENRQRTILFGHWSTLGLHRTPAAVCLDSGCVWGGMLSAYRLEDQQVFQEPARE